MSGLSSGAGGANATPAAAPNYVTLDKLPRRTAQTFSESLNSSTTSAFWTTVNGNGVRVTTDFSELTWKTIADVTGAGECNTIIGPTLPSNGNYVDIRVTIDGDATTYRVTASGAAQRVLLGALSSGFTAANSGMGFGAPSALATLAMGASKQAVTTSAGMLIHPMSARDFNLPRLRFASSLLVEMQTSVAVTTGASQEASAGVTYILD